MLLRIFAVLALATFAACSSTETTQGKTYLSPQDAIFAAAEAVPEGVSASFKMTVVAGGTDRDGDVFLNSEEDYRDQRCLTLAISPSVALAYQDATGTPITEGLMGETLTIDGVAQRTRIDFISDGSRTGLYYYQTHIQVNDTSQIRILRNGVSSPLP